MNCAGSAVGQSVPQWADRRRKGDRTQEPGSSTNYIASVSPEPDSSMVLLRSVGVARFFCWGTTDFSRFGGN